MKSLENGFPMILISGKNSGNAILKNLSKMNSMYKNLSKKRKKLISILLYATKNERFNNAIVLKAYIESRLKKL